MGWDMVQRSLWDLVRLYVYVYCMMYMSVLGHELGHVLAALIIREKFDEFVIGLKYYLVFVFLGCTVKLSPIPIGGFVGFPRRRVGGRLIWKRTSLLFISLSGPMVNIIVSVVCLAIITMWQAPLIRQGLAHFLVSQIGFGQRHPGWLIVLTAAATNMFCAIVSLLPVKGSDGWRIYHVLHPSYVVYSHSQG